MRCMVKYTPIKGLVTSLLVHDPFSSLPYTMYDDLHPSGSWKFALKIWLIGDGQ
jgi:hypothetical protein